ncbi:MAG: hypothetical protein HRT89_24460 [Lentisphaeria bacterium]|nr:hypothetical protein [Lentisphaeria bacterium]NQZ71210.1 hypothetical protein [Lentisphaeria bacterium]
MWPFHQGSNLSQASFILRRIAWLKQMTITKLIKRKVTEMAAQSQSEDLCNACREHDGDKQGSLCRDCVFNYKQEEKAA